MSLQTEPLITEKRKRKPFFPFVFASLFPLRYCPTCKNDTSEVVKAGEKLKASKKKAKMPSATTESQRDWGKVRRSAASSEDPQNTTEANISQIVQT